MYDVFLRFPDYKTKAVTFSYDDGVEQDEKLIHIFNQNGLKAALQPEYRLDRAGGDTVSGGAASPPTVHEWDPACLQGWRPRACIAFSAP